MWMIFLKVVGGSVGAGRAEFHRIIYASPKDLRLARPKANTVRFFLLLVKSPLRPLGVRRVVGA